MYVDPASVLLDFVGSADSAPLDARVLGGGAHETIGNLWDTACDAPMRHSCSFAGGTCSMQCLVGENLRDMVSCSVVWSKPNAVPFKPVSGPPGSSNGSFKQPSPGEAIVPAMP